MKKLTVVAVIIAISAVVLSTSFVVAEERVQQHFSEKILLDGKEYTKDQLIADFLDIAFSNKVWPEDDSGDNFLGAHGGPYNEKEFVKDYPWLSEYMFRGNGYPDPNLLSKWNTESIKIGFGWPRYSHQPAILKGKAAIVDGKEQRCGYSSEYCEFEIALSNGAYGEIISHIKALLPQLEKASGLRLELRMPNDPLEMTKDFARIRIVPVSRHRQKNFFKIYRWGMGSEGYTWSLASNESYIYGAISFTTDIRSQVDGYLIPEADNSLGLSVCKIMPAVGNEMMKALLGECLVRSLGLVDLSDNSEALLGNWNKIYDGSSKLKDLDGRPESVLRAGKTWGRKQEFLLLKDLSMFMKLSEYDQLMLRALYCNSLRPGMDKQEAEEALRRNDYCFKQREKQ